MSASAAASAGETRLDTVVASVEQNSETDHGSTATDQETESPPVTATTAATTTTKDPDSDSGHVSPSPSHTPSPQSQRNQAPGIPDRRKSHRPGKGSPASRGNNRKSSGISIRVTSVADMASEMRLKEADGESNGSHKDDHENDTFEDAASSPQSTTHEPVVPDAKPAAVEEKLNGGGGGAGEGEGGGGGGAGAGDKSGEEGGMEGLGISHGGGLGISNGNNAEGPTLEIAAPIALTDDVNNHGSAPEVSAPEYAKDHVNDRRSTVDISPRMLSGTTAPENRKDHVNDHRSTTDTSPHMSPGTTAPESPGRTTRGLSGDVALPVQPPPKTAERRSNLESRESTERMASSPPRPGFARKASVGFGALLGRMGSIRKPARSPPSRQGSFVSERRNTTASTASTDGEGASGHDGLKPSLQEQFSSLRRQEEFGSPQTNGDTLHEEDEDSAAVSPAGDNATSPPASPRNSGGRVRSPTLDAKLPPGTASGMSAGPPPEPIAVNWDLWQQLVSQGPSAVARTSGDEIRTAITAGIPPAIRGVVWQVLAESKNEELEAVYRTLKARGTEAEHKKHPSSRAGSVADVNVRADSIVESNSGSSTEKEGVASDASSQHSSHSVSAASGAATPPTSVEGHSPDNQPKLLAEKQKREIAALRKLEKAIRRDMGTRTSYSKYTQSAGLQDGLFGVCKAYALFDEGVGYAQGINFIAMPLLFNMAEEEAFTLLVRLMSKYDLRSMFTPDMRGLHLRLYQFEKLLEDYEPAVYCHLKRRNVDPHLYATQWFLTLFVYRFPLQLTLRIYDLILSEGLTAIMKFGIVLIQRNRQALLDIKDMSQLTNFLKEKLFDAYIDKSPSASSLLNSGFFGSVTGGADKEVYRADDMVRDACSIQLCDDTLKAYAAEWDESQRAEREREAEIEHLRTTNATLTTRVKALEERAQQHDTEHVTIAQDLVTLKVENDSLLDANEALKIQVVELQKMVDAQPAEVEDRLKAEMDRIMTRNIEVQNENRGLKEEMAEMEHELVNAKMAHAQVRVIFLHIYKPYQRVVLLTWEPTGGSKSRCFEAKVEQCPIYA